MRKYSSESTIFFPSRSRHWKVSLYVQGSILVLDAILGNSNISSQLGRQSCLSLRLLKNFGCLPQTNFLGEVGGVGCSSPFLVELCHPFSLILFPFQTILNAFYSFPYLGLVSQKSGNLTSLRPCIIRSREGPHIQNLEYYSEFQRCGSPPKIQSILFQSLPGIFIV